MVREQRVKLSGIPDRFTLGTGHVKFFYNKLGYLKSRYHKIYNECVSRSCNVQYYGSAFDGVPVSLMDEYSHTEADRTILLERIHSKGFKLLSE